MAFFDLKKELFHLFRAFPAFTTVLIGKMTVLRAKKHLNFLGIFGTAVRFIFKYSILRELRFITLSAFMPSGNQKECISERAAHLTPPGGDKP
ncbi:hypothetical protein DWU89_06160 [Parabacteroides acidifaciens]|uniref:Uncharacterized protein n=1 Tax=Parabacteroides acidifaciens TaxID=2290935 RepID=A0A3D8HG53_9BACT|nr:hypothetical protein DWU89_06160 [Parabacteroides acidifaciens]